MSIWASTQPPKISPLGLASAGMASVLMASSPRGCAPGSSDMGFLPRYAQQDIVVLYRYPSYSIEDNLSVTNGRQPGAIMMSDECRSFPRTSPLQDGDYSAKDIEVLEGLEPVRRRPGMYIGGSDERAMHHLVAEVIDNAMDEAVAGHANCASSSSSVAGQLQVTVRDNGRGIPVDRHPKFKNKSALEVILTTLHSGAKFSDKAYATSGGLHGVGLSVVNALAEDADRRGRARPQAVAPALSARRSPRASWRASARPRTGAARRSSSARSARSSARRGFHPDLLYRMARSKAYLFRGVEIRWKLRFEALINERATRRRSRTPALPRRPARLPRGQPRQAQDAHPRALRRRGPVPGRRGPARVGRLLAGRRDRPSPAHTATPCRRHEGGSHEQGLRAGMLSARASRPMASWSATARRGPDHRRRRAGRRLRCCCRCSSATRSSRARPRSALALAARREAGRDQRSRTTSTTGSPGHPERARMLLERVIERAEERQRRRQERELSRKTRPASCACPASWRTARGASAEGTEIFLVEGDSAGGSAKQARLTARPRRCCRCAARSSTSPAPPSDRLKGEIRRSPTSCQALGCGTRGQFDPDKLRYERVIIMTDADVDGAHIRLATDDLLLPRDARPDRGAAGFTWRSPRSTA